MRPWFLLLAVIAFSARAELRLTVIAPPAAACATNAVAVVRAEGQNERRVPIEEGRAVVSVDAATAYTVTVEAPECWSETVTTSGQEDVTVRLFSAGVLHGAFRNPAVARAPLKGTVYAIPEAKRDVPPLTVACRLDEGAWRCDVPADLPMDVRLEMPGVGAVHFWDVVVRPRERRELPPQQLYPGASIAGWVHGPDGQPRPGAEVVLVNLEPDTPQITKRPSRRWTARTNRRGFFQFAGLPADDYQMVSHASGLSPAVVPIVTVREQEALTWPRPVTHARLAQLKVALHPGTDTAGKPWVVELAEHVRVPGAPWTPPVARPADAEGRWSASDLRAETYRLYVRNGDGAVLHRAWVDLTAGEDVTLDIPIARIRVTGTLTSGADPLQADLQFSGENGKTVRTTSDAEGHFEAAFPAAGAWTPTIRIAGERATLEAPSVEVPEASGNGAHHLKITLPAGRIRGTVVTKEGAATKAAVHLNDGTRIVAQQITGEDGTFAFRGITARTYTVDAQAKTGATPYPVGVTIEDEETEEVRLVVEPYGQVHGTVLTPQGSPASGAVIRVSHNGGISWTRATANAEGQFRYHVPSGVRDVHLLVLTYAHPSALLRVPLTGGLAEPLVIPLQAAGGLLEVRRTRTPYILRNDALAPMNVFHHPEPFGRFNGRLHLEPGAYAVCPTPRLTDECRPVRITPHADAVVDLRPRSEEKAP